MQINQTSTQTRNSVIVMYLLVKEVYNAITWEGNEWYVIAAIHVPVSLDLLSLIGVCQTLEKHRC